MNDDFEKRLQRQPQRQIPGEWRAEILAAAKATQPGKAAPASDFRFRISNFLWPSPYAWGGLAALWLLMVLVNVSTEDRSALIAQKHDAPPPQIMAAMREQQKLMAELVGPPDSPAVADRPRSRPPQPRSDRRTKNSAV